jgi:hypothetical protein
MFALIKSNGNVANARKTPPHGKGSDKSSASTKAKHAISDSDDEDTEVAHPKKLKIPFADAQSES